MREVAEFLKKCRVFYVATVEDGQPRVRPFGAHLYRDGRLYFMTSANKKVYRQLLENPRLELCSYLEGEWLRLTGEAEFLEDDELKKAFLANSPERARMFYKMPRIAQKALLKKMPGLRNMLAEDMGYLEGARPFVLKNASAALYSIRNETRQLEV